VSLWLSALLAGALWAAEPQAFPGGMPETPAEDIPELSRALRGGDWNERIHAVNALGAAGPAALEDLSYALGDPDWQVRFTAVHWLGRLGKPAVPELQRVLQEEPCRVVRISALHWLGSLDESTLPAIEESLSDESGVLRLNALYWMRKKGALPEDAPLPGANPREDLNVCESFPLRTWKRTRPAPAPSPPAPEAPAASEAQEPPPAAPEVKPDARYQELDALLSGQASTPTARMPREAEELFPIEPLPRRTDGREEEDVETLLRKDDVELGLRKTPPEDVQRTAEASSAPPPIGTKGGPRVEGEGALMPDGGTGRAEFDALPNLLAALKSPDPKARSRAADEVGKRGSAAGQAVPELTKLLSDASPRVRASAALALGNIGKAADPAVKKLVRALRDKSSAVRYSAAVALSRIGTPSADKAFKSYLKSEALRTLQPK